jgi:hypothetical protein
MEEVQQKLWERRLVRGVFYMVRINLLKTQRIQQANINEERRPANDAYGYLAYEGNSLQQAAYKSPS